MEEKTTNKYELAFLLDAQEDIEAINKHIAKAEAEDVVVSEINNIVLSYPIKKREKAYFGYVRFSMAPEKAPALTDGLRLDNKVLRSILIASPIEPSERLDIDSSRERPRKQANREVSNEALEEKLAALQGEAK